MTEKEISNGQYVTISLEEYNLLKGKIKPTWEEIDEAIDEFGGASVGVGMDDADDPYESVMEASNARRILTDLIERLF